MATYDRYASFRNNGTVAMVPFIEIPIRDTDRYETYQVNKTRLDILSYEYYDDANYGWLIMQANPQYGANEFSIPDGAEIRIPYPLALAVDSYINGIKTYNEYYGQNT